MAAGSLFTVLKSIPWTEVVANAPAIAAAARRLWTMATQRGESSPGTASSEESPAGASQGAQEQLLARLQHAEARSEQLYLRVEALQTQLRESSELIRALADQNEQLVARVELNRQRLARQGWTLLALAMAMIVLAGWLVLRG